MDSRLLKDPDMKFFAENLQDRHAGRNYSRAWREAEHCLRQIRLADSDNDTAALDRWRRAYMKAIEECSHRLSVLIAVHRWPAHGS